ncbi:MAG TPA: adenylate/guanylate cyclase domain-containing protein [Dehalococcoidia bacterium]|nr:adenylate/guanylate cyclase domain-containing protein [Dehalococcoidia bacterium]
MVSEPRIQYATTSDGASIAFADSDGPGLPIIYLRGTPFTHVQAEWRLGRFYAYWYENVWGKRRFVTLDCRGCGLSSRNVGELTADAFILDIEAVADKLGFDQFALSGTTSDGLVAIKLAATQPERVSHLMLTDCYPSGAAFAEIPQTKAFLSMMENDYNLFCSTLAHFMNEWDSEASREYMIFLHESTTQEYVLRFFQEYILQTDVGDLLPQVSQPTVVFSHRTMAIPDFETSRSLASRLPNAELVVLDNTWGRPGNDVAVMNAAVDRLLGPVAADVSTPAPMDTGQLVTILFTDVEGSTAMTQRLGDMKSREVMREHERITREALAEHSGSEVKTMGDGFMASFGSAARALQCAIAIQRAFSHLDSDTPINVRIGLNAGEPIAEEEDLFGTSVILAARIAAQAKGGEILASNVVRELVAGRGFLFADRGERALRGFEDPVRVYEVSWREDPA